MRIVAVENIKEANAITHGGVFHADEVLATAILESAIGNVTVCRVSDLPDDLPVEVVVYDIGGGKYDHHQRGGNGVRANGAPYASAGLIWRDFGRCAVASSCSPERVWEVVDREFVQGVDGADCGLSNGNASAGQLTFSQIVSLMNPALPDSSDVADDCFSEAVSFACHVLKCFVTRVEACLRSEAIVEEAIKSSKNRILELSSFAPWKEALFHSDSGQAGSLLFAVYPSSRGGWCWQCVPERIDGRNPRLAVPQEWWGLSGDELRRVTGVCDAAFCHASGFLGVAESREGAVEMAERAINVAESKNNLRRPLNHLN